MGHIAHLSYLDKCYSLENVDPLLWPHSTPGGHDFYILQSSLQHEAVIFNTTQNGS